MTFSICTQSALLPLEIMLPRLTALPDGSGRPQRRHWVIQHVSLLAQRERENEAHAKYLRARKRLLRCAQLSSGPRTSTASNRR